MSSVHTVTIVIPSRKEKYLNRTIHDLLQKATGPIEVIAVLDGYWPPANEIIDDPRVHYIHYAEPRGMRNAINSAVAIARGEYILKTDAHCMFDRGFDEVLKADCRGNWVVVPRRYALDPDKWDTIDNPKYPIDYMYLSSDLHGVPWEEKNKDKKLQDKLIDDLMSAQGSAWFMKKKYYNELELLDEESYGTFFNEFQEIGLKCWLSGGRVVVNKKTWYAHWHKPKAVGRGYRIAEGQQEMAKAFTQKWKDKAWHRQKLPLHWLVNKFAPVPTWI